MDKQDTYLASIHRIYPNLVIDSVRSHNADGQFNDILIINETILFRFPRSSAVADKFVQEVAILRSVQPYLTLSVPNPIFTNWDTQNCGHIFMGYWMLPGQPFWNETLFRIRDNAVLDRLAHQLATFLRELHSVPVEKLSLDLPVVDGHDYWTQMYTAFCDQLFPYMRADAREGVTHNFKTFLNDPRHFAYKPVLRHGDFGSSNILYDPQTQTITGIIDFSFTTIGDPAIDLAAISCSGEVLVKRMYHAYPEMETMWERAQFYKSTYALQQALYGLRDDDRKSFEDGIEPYI